MMARSTLIFYFLISPLSTTAHLRSGAGVRESSSHVPPHRRRMQEIVSYWTPERIDNAIPMDVRVPKQNGRRRLKAFDENDAVVPHRIDNPNQYLIKLGDRYVECTVKREPFQKDNIRRLATPTDSTVSPVDNAVVKSSYVDFIVDIYDADGGDDLKRIIFILDDFSKESKTKFDPDLGNGRYTFTVGPLSEGNYQWAVKVKDDDNDASEKAFHPFEIQISGGQEALPTTGTPPSSRPPATTDAPPTTAGPPTSTTAAPPTDAKLKMKYVSPSSGSMSANPVNFEWEIQEDVSQVLLYLEYPDGAQGFVSRDPTNDGHDSVTLSMDFSGEFRWSIWGQVASGSFEQGPWQKFKIEEGPDDPSCPEKLGHYTDRHQDLHKAIGRIMFRSGEANFLCSGTLVEGSDDRAIIATAGHCVYDNESKEFPDYVMFIPGQDDGEGDGSDTKCTNDPLGCFYPTFGVVSDKYKDANFESGFQYDYGFWVAPDEDPGNNNGPDKDTFVGSTYKALVPMEISFDGMQLNKNAHLFGYPASRDPNFMYTTGETESSPITDGGWYVDCSLLSGGASGGPWTQSDPASGRITLMSVNSWGWSTNEPGMGSPPYNTGGAKCVYEAANSATMSGTNFVATCPP